MTPLKYFTLQTLCSGSILYLRDNISTRLSVSWADYKSRNRSQSQFISSDFEPTSISNRTLYLKISLTIISTIILGGSFRIQFTYYIIWYSVIENI